MNSLERGTALEGTKK